MTTDTIFALATGPGRGAVAVIRVSGPAAFKCLQGLGARPPQPRKASLRRLSTAEGAPLDQALVLTFPGPSSFTGEDVVELHLHGGPAVVEAALDSLAALGARLATPGEFTRRAFENGLVDLAQAEAVADLVDAETSMQRRQALSQLQGGLSRSVGAWRDSLLEALAQLEAYIDFPDEDLPPEQAAFVQTILGHVAGEIAERIQDPVGISIRDGFRIALVGAPNSGKSTLLNALVGREAAIVTAVAGTTRDVIEVPLVLGGCKVTLADTAGQRETCDPIEAEGVRRAEAWSNSADLRLWVAPLGSPAPMAGARDWIVWTMADLHPQPNSSTNGAFVTAAPDPGSYLSLAAGLTAWVVAQSSGADSGRVTRLRHQEALKTALAALKRAADLAGAAPELLSEDIRAAARALERIVGRINPEDVLDRVFASFCIGK